MQKDKLTAVGNFIVKHCKIVFPVLVVVVVAFTVSVALKANGAKGMEQEQNSTALATAAPSSPGPSLSAAPQQGEDPVTPPPEEIPLTENADEEIASLVTSYYNAMALGDSEVLTEVFDSVSTEEMLRFTETAKYIDGYGACEIFTKQGLTADSVVACVYYKVCFVNHEEEIPGYRMLYLCRDEEGKYRIKNESNFSEEEKTYIKEVIAQADVAEFNNRVTVEYKELMHQRPELLEYLAELDKGINKSIGEGLAALGVTAVRQTMGEAERGSEDSQEGSEGEEGSSEGQQPPDEPYVPEGLQFATATTTVNVRSSDSEKADKLGKVSGGARVQVQEVGVNGWTKIVYEGKDGFIKSEYLRLEESTEGLEAIGTVTATTSINVRAAASQSSERLGLLPAGESLELLGSEDGWCKVKYNGRVAYVKADYVTQQ